MAPIKRRSSSQNAATESGTGRSPAPPATSLATVLKPAEEAALTFVLSRAVEVLGSKQRAFRWLGSPVPSLKNATPISLLFRAKGRESVLTVLGRMEHGIFGLVAFVSIEIDMVLEAVRALADEGRWNPIGSKAIYAAPSVSLAVLEILVHHSELPANYVLTEITIPDRVSRKELSLNKLSNHWDRQSPIPATQIIGQMGIQHAESAVLIVASSVVPADRNYVLNPNHRDFAKIRFATPSPFRFDPRLR